tara:strand:+ start:1994 stop:2893 length:900 start_codon:yes stop_codon:yes gene_type:complete
MVQIPKSLNHSNITDTEIRAYFSLTPCEEDHEIHAKRFDKIIKEYMTNTQSFKSKNAEYSFKKRIKNWAKDRPDNSKVWDAFMSWRIGQINRHIAKQRDGGFTKQSVTEKEQRDLICQLRREILQKDMIIKGLTEENNKLKSGNKIDMIIEEVVKDEVNEEIMIEEVKADPYGLAETDSDFEDDPQSESEEEEEEEEEVIVKKEEEEIITGLYETCEKLEEATELYYETCDKQADKMEKLLNKSGDNKQDLKNDYFDWLQNERETLDELHAIDIDDPLWDKLVDKPYEVFGDNLNQLMP